MIILGLTGSIGMGKTTVAGMLARMGCGVHNSDKAVHEALKPNGDAFEEVALTFPAAWNKKTKTLKRDILAEIIFNDESSKYQLEEILHPIVQKSQNEFIQKQNRMGRDILVLDIPLLFETEAQERVDFTVVVSAPLHVQKHRVLSRANMTEGKFYKILKSQMPDAEKRARADFVIPTGMGMAYTRQCLVKMMKDIKCVR